MDNLSLRFVFDRKGETKKDASKKALVQIEVYDKKTIKKAYISTGVKIKRDQYSPHGGFSIKNHPNAVILKSKAHVIFNRVEAFVNSDKCNNLSDVKNWNKEDEELTTSIIDFIKEDLRRRDVSYPVLEYNNSFLKRLEEFGKIKVFKDLTYSNIEELDLFLKKTIKSQPTLYKRHSLFKGYIERAKKKGFISYNPYDDFENKKGHSKDPIFLHGEELQRIIDYQPRSERMQKVKDLFIFQCFTGLAYADMSNFSKNTIVEVDGMKEIRGFRQKTNQRFVALLLPMAEKIAEKYDYKLPVMSNQKMNAYLKEIGDVCGIDKNLTFHLASHNKTCFCLKFNALQFYFQRQVTFKKRARCVALLHSAYNQRAT